MNQDIFERVLAFLSLVSLGVGATLVYLKVEQDVDIDKGLIILVFGIGVGIPCVILGSIEAPDETPSDDCDVDLDL